MRDERLFSGDALDDVITHLQAQLRAEVEKQDRDYLLQVSVNDLVDHLVSKFSLEAPTLDPDGAEIVESREVQIDATNDFGRYWSTPGPHTIPGQRIVIAVPFAGDGQIFSFRTNPGQMGAMTGFEVKGNALHVIYEGTNLDGEQIKTGWRGRLDSVELHLNWARDQIKRHNDSLERLAREAGEARRTKILADRNTVESIGLPVRKRDGEPMTYTVSAPKRKTLIPKPAASREPFAPEPELDAQQFDEILSVVRHMAAVMERSPHAFASMGEEDLRQHFLVQLNGTFEGAATGETFNSKGKTDILIRVDGKNVFIAECKIWNGPDTLTKTIDQILGYLAWRDTKERSLCSSATRTSQQFSIRSKRSSSSTQTTRRPWGVYRRRSSDSSSRSRTTPTERFRSPSCSSPCPPDRPTLSSSWRDGLGPTRSYAAA